MMHTSTRFSTSASAHRTALSSSRVSSRAKNAQWSSDVVSWQEMRLRMCLARCAGSTVATADASPAPVPVPAAAPAAAPDAAAPAAPPAPAPEPDVTACDIRVGRIIKCEKHPDADSLYVEQIDVGEPEPRTIVSGLVQYVPLEQMQDRDVLVICNLKPRNMRGIKSAGMVLCASTDEPDAVEPLVPPAGCKPGERVWFGEGNQNQPAPAEPNRVQKKKIWEGVQPLLKTNGDKAATFKGTVMLTTAGPVTVPNLANANIS